ncbi:MAG: HAMP domain-containing protein [Myxococcales bacterium]|nr:HAMP domain-containing protein [Myxococcales bacterium]
MRLYHKLVLFMLAATVLPLASVGFWLLRESERELGRRIAQEQRAVAAAAAEGTAHELLSAVNALGRSVALFRASSATVEERKGLVSLMYAQSPMVSAAVWIEPNSPPLPVFFAKGQGGHPGFEPKGGLERLFSAIPPAALAGMRRGEVALSPGYPHSLGQMGALAVALKLDDGPIAPYALVELGLSSIERELAGRAASLGRLDLVDGAGMVLASSEPMRRLRPLEADAWQAASRGLAGEPAATFLLGEGRLRRQVSVATVPDQLGLIAVSSVEEAVALAPVRALRRTVLLAVGGALGLLLALGLLFTRKLNSRLAKVADGAMAYAKGELSRRISMEGADELTELSDTFNKMGAELEAARARLTRWNDELKARVEEATADLKAAQEKLLEAQKMAAVGQLGAGVAHEINNPLCGILGNAQLLMLDHQEGDPDFETLSRIEQSAKRCKDITQSLLRFAESQGRAELRSCDLNAVVRDAVAKDHRQNGGEGVEAKSSLQSGSLMVFGDPGLLSQVVSALLSNARIAMAKSERKELSVCTREQGAEVHLEVQDTGKGIKPEHLPRIFEPFFTTKDVWSNLGLGLSIAYRVMQEHGGRVEVATELGQGSTFTVKLPRLTGAERAQEPRQARPTSVGGQGAGITG